MRLIQLDCRFQLDHRHQHKQAKRFITNSRQRRKYFSAIIRIIIKVTHILLGVRQVKRTLLLIHSKTVTQANRTL